MNDEPQLHITVRHSDSVLILSPARSGLVARGRKDAAALAERACPQSEEEGLFEKTRRLAEQGDAGAQSYLGYMYRSGLGVEQDYAEAVKWYRKAADQGDGDAQCNLGVMYCSGLGVEQDYAEAVKWYRKAADQGRLRRRTTSARCTATV